jgi:acyl carrier protein
MITTSKFSFEDKIGDLLDSILKEEGFATFEETDSLSRLTILDFFEDEFDINIDISVMDKIQTRKDIIEQVTLALLLDQLNV